MTAPVLCLWCTAWVIECCPVHAAAHERGEYFTPDPDPDEAPTPWTWDADDGAPRGASAER